MPTGSDAPSDVACQDFLFRQVRCIVINHCRLNRYGAGGRVMAAFERVYSRVGVLTSRWLDLDDAAVQDLARERSDDGTVCLFARSPSWRWGSFPPWLDCHRLVGRRLGGLARACLGSPGMSSARDSSMLPIAAELLAQSLIKTMRIAKDRSWRAPGRQQTRNVFLSRVYPQCVARLEPGSAACKSAIARINTRKSLRAQSS